MPPVLEIEAAVYPRWRGELVLPLRVRPELYGLSPLARGTRSDAGRDDQEIRFIPAGAGNSAWVEIGWGGVTVYPRWRGELAHNGKRAGGNIGLSPLARGTQSPEGFGQTADRFIPAGAGNSCR